MIVEPSIPVLRALLASGSARIPVTWSLAGPGRAGLWWRVGSDVVATPALVRLASALESEDEAVGALLATEGRFRAAWLGQVAARLTDLGGRGATVELIAAIERIGPAAAALRPLLANARWTPTPFTAVEIATQGAPADQPAALPSLLRIIGATAPLVEGRQGRVAEVLPSVHPLDPSVNWVPGRLLQAPTMRAEARETYVLSGATTPGEAGRMRAVLASPWLMLLAIVVFTAEAWAAERHGGLVLELPTPHLSDFASPARVDVVVTLEDGREVVCGTLGELCARVVDALGMAIVPAVRTDALDAALAPAIAWLLWEGVWVWQPVSRPRYAISNDFSVDCYRGEGHRYINRAGDSLSQVVRSVAVAWARARLERAA